MRATKSALIGSSALGFSFDEIVEIVVTLTSKDFYKGMTTYADHKIWQDVYYPMTKAGKIYLKLTVIEDVLILSFKEV